MTMRNMKLLPPGFRNVRGRLIHLVTLPGLMPSGPTILFVHGVAATASSWLPLINCLKSRASKFVIFDLPGHGFSGQADKSFNIEEAYLITRDILMLEAEPESENILVGNSLGGALAMRFTLDHPEVLTRTILISPAGVPFPVSAHAVLDTFITSSLGETRTLLHRILVHSRITPTLLAPQVYYNITRPAFRGLIDSICEYDTDEDSKIRHLIMQADDLASCKVPVQFIWGKQDHILPEEMRDYFVRYLPDFCTFIYPETFGHCPQMEEPKLLADIMDI